MVKDLTAIFDPENKYDTYWNCTEIDPDWLEDVGIYFDQERHNFYELKPFYDLRNSTLAPLDGMEDYEALIQQPAVYNTLEPIRRIHNAKSHLIEYVNAIKYVEPQFPGGEQAFWKFIQNNFKMPKSFDGERGRVIALFDIDENGKVVNVRINRSYSPDVDRELIRVIQSLPNFTPGLADGKPHKFTGYKVPLNIRAE